VGCDAHDFHEYSLTLDPVENSKLPIKPRRSMALPFAEEGLIMKPLDQPQALWAGNSDDVFPLLVSLQNIRREAPKLPSDALVLKHLPHILNDIYVL
jgi:hypothetical protein